MERIDARTQSGTNLAHGDLLAADISLQGGDVVVVWELADLGLFGRAPEAVELTFLLEGVPWRATAIDLALSPRGGFAGGDLGDLERAPDPDLSAGAAGTVAVDRRADTVTLRVPAAALNASIGQAAGLPQGGFGIGSALSGVRASATARSALFVTQSATDVAGGTGVGETL